MFAYVMISYGCVCFEGVVSCGYVLSTNTRYAIVCCAHFVSYNALQESLPRAHPLLYLINFTGYSYIHCIERLE